MYYDFYGFREPPFNITPDPRFLFFSEKHREAFNHLLFGLRERKGFIQITGEIGAGKTTLCRALLRQLDARAFASALVLNPRMNNTQLLRTILREFHLDAEATDRVELLDRLNLFLIDQFRARRDVVLIVDDAQALTLGALEQIRLLSNLETDQRKLLQIILIGQPELRDKLRKLEQLRQRITIRYHLRALKPSETSYYIQHRLAVAGANHPPSFTKGAVRGVQRYSRGVPRLINAVSDKTLLCGYVEQTWDLRARHVRRAIKELEGETR